MKHSDSLSGTSFYIKLNIHTTSSSSKEKSPTALSFCQLPTWSVVEQVKTFLLEQSEKHGKQ
jgi:hypothetical protein